VSAADASGPDLLEPVREPEIVMVSISRIKFGKLSPRRVDTNHVRILKASSSFLPPILVDEASMEVVDGAHRLTVAKELGQVEISVEWFRGSHAEAIAEAIRRNAAHGKPLSQAERRRAVENLLAVSPYRRIAGSVGSIYR
jgi:ParB-like chromosome segregation protein Spo0J